jgi:hypothetical protein
MPLPKLNTPTYSCFLPVSKKEVEYRPFLVSEEKILLIARESSDEKETVRAITKCLSACTFNKITIADLTMPDFEYLFLQIRIKSVGETAEIRIKCQDEECGAFNPVSVNLSEIQVVFPEETPDTKLMLSDNVGVILRFPKVSDALQAQTLKSDEKKITSMIRSSIEQVFDDSSTYSMENVSEKEFEEFIGSMSRKNLEDIQDFVQNQPSLEHTVTFTCLKCGKESKVVLRGLNAFFQ